MLTIHFLLVEALAASVTALSLGAPTLALSSSNQLQPRSPKLMDFDFNKFISSLKRDKGDTQTVAAKKSPNDPDPASVVPETTRKDINGVANSEATSGGKLVIDSVNAFRREKGLNMLNWSPQLATNAAKTGQATGGRSMQHLMGPGTNGQVLIMGYDNIEGCKRNLGGYTPFELFYYSWLCEVPGDAALKGKCSDVLQKSRINNMGQRGHYDILTAKKYKTIGCAFTTNSNAQKCSQFTGIWACDLGM